MKITATVLETTDRDGDYRKTAPLRIVEIDLAPPGPDELLLKIEAAGLCHSDLSVINGDRPRPLPMALGHEAVGTVLEAGRVAAQSFEIGDRVVLSFLPQCGECERCISGEPYLCSRGAASNGAGTLLSGAVRLSEDGHPVHHHLGASAFASHAVVDRRSAVRIPADIPAEIAALFGCAVLTGVGAVLNTGKLVAGESVAIYGLGGVGLAALMGAIAGGAQPVVAIDPLLEKRELALELGAVAAFDTTASHDEISRALGGRPDLVVETVGRAAVLGQAFTLARIGGRIVTVGLPREADTLDFSPLALVAEGKSLIGSYMGSSVPARDIPRYIKLWRAGRLPVERLLSSVTPLGEINTLFARLHEGTAIRQIVKA